MALTEKARHHQERRPQFRATFDTRNDPRAGHETETFDVVAFAYVTGPSTLDSVDVTLVHRSEATQPPIMSIGAEIAEPTVTSARLSTPLELGQERMVRVGRHPDEHGGLVPFRLHCVADKAKWTFVVECEVPDVPKVFASWD